jgi:tight adherence protein B
VKLDGLLWLALPLVAVGLWLLHDGLQRREKARRRRPSRVLLRLKDYLVQADLERWTPMRLMLVCLVSAATAAVFAQLIVDWPLATLMALVIGALAPVRWIQRRHGRVHNQTRQGLAAALSQLAGSLAVGHTIERGAQTLATDGPQRLRPYFAQFCRDVDDLDLARAAVHLRERLADPVADLFVAGLLLHTELGGDDFRPMLGQLEKMTRAQQAIRDQVTAARVRLKYSAYVLVAAPVVILLVLRAWSPVVSAYFNSPQGVILLFLCALATLCGYLLMLYLGRMPGDERVLVR